MTPNKRTAFSLIELLITMAIIAILASIAVPTYRDYVVRARVTTALSNLIALKNKVEVYYVNNGSAPTSAAQLLGITVAADAANANKVFNPPSSTEVGSIVADSFVVSAGGGTDCLVGTGTTGIYGSPPSNADTGCCLQLSLTNTGGDGTKNGKLIYVMKSPGTAATDNPNLTWYCTTVKATDNKIRDAYLPKGCLSS